MTSISASLTLDFRDKEEGNNNMLAVRLAVWLVAYLSDCLSVCLADDIV